MVDGLTNIQDINAKFHYAANSDKKEDKIMKESDKTRNILDVR
jgi:hypothetical protein